MIEQFLRRDSVLGSVTNMLLSAGTLSSNRSDVTFADSNGVTFGLNTNGVITASVGAGGGGAGTGFTTATTAGTNIVGTLGGGGLSMGVPAYLTTAMASNAATISNINVSAGTTSNNLSAVTFSNSNNVSFGLNASTITAIATVASTQGSINLSAGTTSNLASAFTFSNSNNVSFGLNASTITASIATTYAGTGFTTATTAGTNIVGTLNTSGLSLGVPAYLTTAMQSNAATISNINVSAGTTSNNLSAITFSNSNNVSFGLNGSTLTASIATTYAGTGFTTATTAGTAIVGTLNTSGLSMGVPAYLTTAMQSNAATISNINISAGTTSTNASAFTFANANNVSFGLGTGASTGSITASIATTYAGTGFTTATTAGTAIVGTLNTSGLSMGVPAYLTTAELSRQFLSYYANIQYYPNVSLPTSTADSNTFNVFPLSIPEKISIGYMRMIAFGALTSTTIATSAVNNATGASTSFNETIQYNAVLYTAGTGANSRSLQYVYSTSVGVTWQVSVSQASTSNASQQTISQALTFPREGFTTVVSNATYSVSATNGPISTTQFGLEAGNVYLDVPFSTSLSAGVYWMAFNRFTGTVGGKNMDVNYKPYGVNQSNVSFGIMGLNINVSNCGFQFGLGSWTTNVAQTTSSIAFASISASTSYFLPYVQFINQS